MALETAGDSGGTATAVADAGSPTPSVTPESASPGTTTAAGEQTPPSPKGPVPYDRFEEINRKYTALKWAETHDPDRVNQQTAFFKWLDTDALGAHEYLTNYLRRAGVLKDHAPGHAPKDERPQPDRWDQNGTAFYSAEAAEKLAKWEAAQATKPIDERLSRFEADRTRAKYENAAASLLREAESWDHYKEHEAEILHEMERDKRLSLEGAYRRVVFPKLRELERQTVLTELKAKSTASTHSPSSQTASQSAPASKQSWTDLFRREMAKRGGRA